MKEILDFLGRSAAFHVATVDSDGQPHVRPFSFAMEWDKLLTFTTSTEKRVYRQLRENPRMEISSFDADSGQWMRITAEICFVSGPALRKAVLEKMPELKALYSEDDPKMIGFSVISGVAAFYSFTSGPEPIRTIELSRI